MDCLLALIGAPWVCFLVLSVLLLPDLVLFKLLFLVLSLCLYGEAVARGGLSGSLQSEVGMSERQQIHETRLFGGHYMLLLTSSCSLHGAMNCSDRSMSLAGPTLIWIRVRVKVTSLHEN